MKYKTFRALVVSGLLLSVGSCVYLGGEAENRTIAAADRQPSVSVPTTLQPLQRPVVAIAPVQPAPVSAEPFILGPLRTMDDEILQAIARGISGDKVKDAIRGKMWKVNLYQDAGNSAVNRLKIDLDRDDKWDEKWSLEPEGWKRQIAPADDEQYREETWYHVQQHSWVKAKPVPGSGTASTVDVPATPVATPAAVEEKPVVAGTGQAFREFDSSVLALTAGSVTGGKKKDALPGAVKVNLYQDAGKPSVNRLKIDLDRDDKWDEKWTVEDAGILREVAPEDDEKYIQKYFLPTGASRWEER